MTPRHWVKMVGSALLIFVIGLTLTRVVSAGGHRLGNLITTEHSFGNQASEIGIPLNGLAFTMNDRALGSVQHVSVMRSSPTEIHGMHFVVKLDKGVTADRFANCELTAVDPAKIDMNTKFTCVASGDPGYDELVRFGTIDFISPGHGTQHHRFEVPQNLVESLQAASTTAMQNSGVSDAQANTNSDGHFQVMVNGQKVVEINGNDAGGSVVIRDPKTGANIVDINGSDAGGGNVVIRDPATGKNIIEIHGSDAGDGTVKINGANVDAKSTTVKGANVKAPAKP